MAVTNTLFKAYETERYLLGTTVIKATWLEVYGVAQIHELKGNLMRTMGLGYKVPDDDVEAIGAKHLHALYPEECLYLLERGDLVLFYLGSMLSVEDAYVVILASKSYPLSLDQYTVYAYMRRLGYVIRRHNALTLAKDKKRPKHDHCADEPRTPATEDSTKHLLQKKEGPCEHNLSPKQQASHKQSDSPEQTFLQPFIMEEERKANILESLLLRQKNDFSSLPSLNISWDVFYTVEEYQKARRTLDTSGIITHILVLNPHEALPSPGLFHALNAKGRLVVVLVDHGNLNFIEVSSQNALIRNLL